MQVEASHVQGGHITYTSLGGNVYNVQYSRLQDCGGIPPADSVQLLAESNQLGICIPFWVHLQSTQVNTIVCPGINTSCSGGNITGQEQVNYSGTVTLSGTSADWMFSFFECCRQLMTSLNGNGSNIGLIATLDNSTSPNNSVQISAFTNSTIQANSATSVNFGAYESDGDSVVYSLVAPLEQVPMCTSLPITTVAYAAGYSATSPFGTNGTASINATTGTLNLQCSLTGIYLIAVKAQEYRNGVLVGTVMHEFTVTVVSGTNNAQPQLTGINGGTTYTTSINACSGASLSFTCSSSDADASDSTYIDWLGLPVGATYSNMFIGTNAQSTITWQPTSSNASSMPYVFQAIVRDNKCPQPGAQVLTYLVYVNQCNTDTVWPGDANADFIVDNFDVLAIGVANSATGLARPGANTTWTAQYVGNWAGSFVSGVNHKHADCDGNGTVDIAVDAPVVSANYGLWHSKKFNTPRKDRGLPELKLDLTSIKFIPGTTVTIPITLGSANNACVDFYGLASTFTISTNASASNMTVTKAGTWIPAANSYGFDKAIIPTRNEFALTKTNAQGSNGFGQIGSITISIPSNAAIGGTVNFGFVNVKAVKPDGSDMQIDVPTQSAMIETAGSIEGATSSSISLLPNITSAELQIIGAQDQDIFIANMQGQRVMSIHHEVSKPINVAGLANGLYYVQLPQSGIVLRFCKQ
ncbi:MAG: hypothetical protein RL660_1539 [Bacteroidota bacterium]